MVSAFGPIKHVSASWDTVEMTVLLRRMAHVESMIAIIMVLAVVVYVSVTLDGKEITVLTRVYVEQSN